MADHHSSEPRRLAGPSGIVTPAHIAGFSRILLAPVMFVVLFDTPTWRAVGVGVVAAAGVSDILDGRLARRYGTVSTFGVFLDLTADKVFVLLGLLALSRIDRAPLAVVAIVLIRETVIMGLRAYAAAQSYVVPGGGLGAAKTIVLFAGMGVALLAEPVGAVLLWTGTLLAVISGAEYAARIARHRSQPD